MLAGLGMAALSFGRHALKMGPLVLACSLPSREACSVEITLRGKTMRLPALREQRIMKLRFGLGGGQEMTQKEVADVLGISQSYISRLEKRILSRLHSEMLKATS